MGTLRRRVHPSALCMQNSIERRLQHLDRALAWLLLAANLFLRDAGAPARFAIEAVARLRLCRLVVQARAHELLPSVAAHPDRLRHTLGVVCAGGWADREEHCDDATENQRAKGMPAPGNVRGQNCRQSSFDCLCRHRAASLAQDYSRPTIPAKQRLQQLPGLSGSSSGIYGTRERAAVLGSQAVRTTVVAERRSRSLQTEEAGRDRSIQICCAWVCFCLARYQWHSH